jgi:hypothetical protein
VSKASKLTGAAPQFGLGLALGSVNGAHYLYATDLHNNKIDVFDTNFSKPAAMQGKFIDPGDANRICAIRYSAGEWSVVRHLRDAGFGKA